MKKDNLIKITISGNGLSYSEKIEQNLAGQIIALCLSASKSANVKPESTGSFVISDNTNGAGSPSEYYRRYAPARNPDKILTLASYIKESRGTNSFHPAEIKSLFRDVAEILPANFIRDMQTTVKLGWISRDHNKKGNYYITITGEKVLSEGFPKELGVRRNGGPGRKK